MYITGIEPTQVDDAATFLVGQLGQTSDGKTYKYLQYSDGTGNLDAAGGDVVFYSGATGYDTGTVTVDATDAVGVGAGVAQTAMTDGQFGWFQVRGFATLSTALTGGADGNALTAVGAGDRTLDVSALVTDHICAIALDASAQQIYCDFPL